MKSGARSRYRYRDIASIMGISRLRKEIHLISYMEGSGASIRDTSIYTCEFCGFIISRSIYQYGNINEKL